MVAGTAIPLGIANSAIRGWQNQYMGTGAMDFNISPADQLRFRYVHNRLQSNDSGANLPFFNTGRDRTSLLASISHYHSFGSRVQNELRVGYNRFNQRFHDGSFDFPGVDVFPTIQLQEANLTLGPNLGFAQESVWNTYHVADGVSINANRHNLRIGFDGRRYIASRNGLASSRGQFGFSSLERFLLDVSPDIASERSFGDIGFSPNQWLLFGYVQDNWVVHRKVHVNLGLRYEYVTLPTGMKLQDLNSQAGVPGVLEFSRPRIENRMFAPNVGIAVSPFETTVIRAGFGMSYDALYSSFWPIGIAPVMGRTAFGNLMTDQIGFFRSGGLTATPFDQNATPAQIRSGITTFFGEQELPYSLQWNAGVQQGLGRRTTLEVKYLGSRGMHLPVWTRLNDPMRVTADRSLPLFFQTPTQAQLNALNLTLADVQRLQPNAFTTAGFTSPITTIDPGGKSWYHAGTAALRTNFTGGVQLFGAYTWSHLIEDSTGTPMDLAFPTRIRSESFYDRRHRLTATWLWDVAGAFSDTSSWVRNIIADLKLSGTYTFESAPWITALAGRDLTLSGFGGFSTPAFVNTEATGFGGSGVTPLRNRNNQIVAYQVTDPSARFISGAPGVFFNPRRGSFPLRDINNWDVSVAKGFSWRERLSFEVRADAYNLFNHTEFSTSNIRSIEAQPLAPLFLIPGNPEFGNIEGNIASNSRILQLALRLTF
jgi:hypothetical protein